MKNRRKLKKFTNPFGSLLDLYKKQVRKADKRCSPERLAGAAEAFFDDFSEYSFSDIEYLDGYFLFGFGTNSVVHFHIDECPGWKFGIWWDVPENKKARYIHGTLFAQYEEGIDKFKPSASALSCNFTLVPESRDATLYEPRDMIKFIKDEPALAFCRDQLFWNYNYEYHSREEAEEEFRKWKEHRENEHLITEALDSGILDLYRGILESIPGSFIADRGDGWSPRYDLVAPSREELPPGCYHISEDEEFSEIIWSGDIESAKNFSTAVREYVDESEKTAYDNGVWWFRPIDNFITIYDRGLVTEEEERKWRECSV